MYFIATYIAFSPPFPHFNFYTLVLIHCFICPAITCESCMNLQYMDGDNIIIKYVCVSPSTDFYIVGQS